MDLKKLMSLLVLFSFLLVIPSAIGAVKTFQVQENDMVTISPEALELARENAKRNHIENRIFFIESDLLEKLSPTTSSIIIVTNLPYIPTPRIPYLDPSVKDFEPRVALDGGPDGFELYRKLFHQISQLRMHNPGLKSNAQTGIGKLILLVCEIDYTHGELAVQEAQKCFPSAKIEVKTDLAHNIRILLISNNSGFPRKPQ